MLMYYYEDNSGLLLDIVILIGVLSLIIFIFNSIMRILLHVKRPKWFSNNYVNDIHEKYDKKLRLIAVIAYIGAGFYFIYTTISSSSDVTLYLFLLGMIFTGIQELFRAYMEWKYLEGKNDYLFTLSQVIFISTLVIVALRSEFFGLLG